MTGDLREALQACINEDGGELKVVGDFIIVMALDHVDEDGGTSVAVAMSPSPPYRLAGLYAEGQIRLQGVLEKWRGSADEF